ncbi:sigma-70 family RNA polymerase sigma factor [Candidatus Woesearchaeota archaeon]|nr:sigma-70 family RNA polymerase sigma factor [Candidatus Woesearchaeota archaeon]
MTQRKPYKSKKRIDFASKNPSDLIGSYLSDIGNYELLSKEKEIECAKIICFYRPRLLYNLCMLSRYENDLEDRLNKAYVNYLKSHKDPTKTKKDIFINNMDTENWKKLDYHLETANKLNKVIENLGARLKNIKSKDYKNKLKLKIKNKKEKKFRLFNEFCFSRHFRQNLIKYTLSKYNNTEFPKKKLSLEKQEYVKNLFSFYKIYESAFKKLFLGNWRLVFSIAKNFENKKNIHLLDLIQEGNKGLMKAIERFDYKRGNKFSTYATWWIRQVITRTLANQSRTIVLPSHISDLVIKIEKNFNKTLLKKNGSNLISSIAKKTGESIEQIKIILNIINQDEISAELGIGKENNTLFRDFIIDKNTKIPWEMAQKFEIKERIEKALDSLSPREKQIVCFRYAIGCNFHTLDKIGKILGITRERVRQIEKGALKKLQHPVRSKKLKNLLDTKYL